MMNCQLPKDEVAGTEVQLVAAKAVHHLPGLLWLQFEEGSCHDLSRQP